MTTHPIITAGQALATFASDIAHDAIQASGDHADGKYALTLVSTWVYAVSSVQQGDIDYALGRDAGKQYGTAIRDELLDLAAIIVAGFRAALDLTGLYDALDPDHEKLSMVEIDIAIANAMGAASRLHTLILETGGQLPIPLVKPTL